MSRVADDLQIELMRKATPGRKLELTFSMSARHMERLREDLRVERPDLPEREIGLLFVERNYGAELASRVRAELASRAG